MIRLVIADDHPVFRAGIKALLALRDGIQIVGEAADGNQAFQLVRDLKPDVLLMDMEMPGAGGLDVVRRLKSIESDIQVLILSGYADPDKVIGIMDAGVSGYLLKDEPLGVIAESIGRVFNGGIAISRRISDLVLARRSSQTADDLTEHARMVYLVDLGLTPHLFRVLSMVAEGMDNKEIGKILHKSPHTVRNQVDKLRMLTESAWRPALVAWYWRQQVFLLDEAEFARVYGRKA